MSEIFVERMHLALETTRGTAVTTPTHTFNYQGLITPGADYLEPAESRGELASVYRPQIARQGSAWTLEGQADVNYLPVLANMAVVPLTSPSTPTNGVLTRLWAFVPTMTADDIKAATMIWDLDVQSLVADYCMIDSLTLSNDANGTDGLMVSVSGAGGFPADIATPTPAANIAGAMFPGVAMQLWIDTGGDAIGTTEYTDTHSLVSAQHVISTGVTYKHVSAGPGAALDFNKTGRDKAAVRMVTTIQVEMPDMTLFDLWTADTTAKVRVRHNGPLIESVTPDYYNYTEVDVYGKMKFTGWGINQNSNRVANYMIESIKDATLGAGWRLAIQNARTAL
jgi:hypothetical protein